MAGKFDTVAHPASGVEGLMGKAAFIVHGHFYQPPREDPLTGKIPVEPGAAPYRNWNERIHAECYRPNAELGNFEKISFNIGPTLFSWMESYDPVTYARILEQDRRNVRLHGVGNAMAQAYNHTILPLASLEDKYTQVLWGIADFEHRFQRKPKGMWLPETAVDLETLEVLTECGIKYTILAPWQAAIPQVDTSQPYWVSLPSGRHIVVFFYQQDLSTRVSFDPGSTTNADDFLVNHLVPKYNSTTNNKAQLVMIASDGELYGHHQPFRDKFLSHLMNGALSGAAIVPTYPELWLRDHPPRSTIEIRENSSWSCHHGVTRWRGECGCTPYGSWKAPLRQGLTQLAAVIDYYYEQGVRSLVPDPWQLRHEYISVILGQERVDELANRLAGRHLDEESLWKIEMLLSAQFERQRMFTSCAWFFDDFDRIEPGNNVAYAAKASWLTSIASRIDLTPEALALLRPVRSPRTGLSAEKVYTYYLNRVQTQLGGTD